MVFTFQNHLELERAFYLATLCFLHELEWQLPRLCKIQHWGPSFWIPVD